jgi:hypothetical protein
MEDRVTILPPPPSARRLARAAVVAAAARGRRRLLRAWTPTWSRVRAAAHGALASLASLAERALAMWSAAERAPEPGPVLPGGERVSALVARLLAEQAAREERAGRPTRAEARRSAATRR